MLAPLLLVFDSIFLQIFIELPILHQGLCYMVGIKKCTRQAHLSGGSWSGGMIVMRITKCDEMHWHQRGWGPVMVWNTLFSRLCLFIYHLYFIFLMQSTLLLSFPTLCPISLLCLTTVLYSFPWKKKKKQGLKHPPLSSRLLRAMMEKVFYEAFFGFTHSREEKVILINFYYVSGLSHFFICQAV